MAEGKGIQGSLAVLLNQPASLNSPEKRNQIDPSLTQTLIVTERRKTIFKNRRKKTTFRTRKNSRRTQRKLR